MTGSERPVLLVDASPYIFRGYFSLPASITSADGRPANATYGFASFLVKLLSEEAPTHVAITFDESLTTSFRNEMLPTYKADRALPPPELEAQLKDCQEAAAALGLACFVSERYEADDLIATLVRRLEPGGHRCVVVTSDKDLAQLVTDRVTLYDAAKGVRLDAAGVREKLGVEPSQVVDLLALAGDPVDSIPGVPGIGRKTAAELLARFRTLDGIYECLADLPTCGIRGAKALVAKLEAGRELAYLSRRLAVAAFDAPMTAGFDDLRWDGASRPRIEALTARLGMKTVWSRVPRWRDD